MSENKSSKSDSSTNQCFVIGNYMVSQTIGQGTYGKVRLGSNIQTKEKVAVKVIEKSQVKSPKQIARLQREIRFLKLLNHPHIIRLYDVIETTENIFIVMEYATGGELFDYIVANKRVKENEARSFFRMVIKAIDYCHKHAIIHRDLKPENLLLDENKQIKIIDFGFGNNFSNGKLLDTFCGSPFYAAPEMILGKKYIGPEVDMWSLGVILFALLCGHLPFDDENMKELYKKISNGTYRCPDYVMPNAKHLISRLITVDPKKRATMREVFSHPWVNEGFPFEPEDSYLHPSPIKHINDLSQDIVGRLIIFGYSKEEIIKAFEIDQEVASPNPIRSTYYLLQDMVEREQSRFREKNPAHINPFLKKKECSSLTLVSSSEHSLYSMTNNSIHTQGSTDKIQSPPGAHISQRTHSDKIPAHDMDLMNMDPSKPFSSKSNDQGADLNSKGLFGFSLAQVAVSQIQKLYSVPSSIYNSLSGTTTHSIGQNKDAAFETTAPQSARTNNTKPIKKDPRAIVNDFIRVLSGTDARWHFESEFRIICEMDANAYLPAEMEIEDKVGVSQAKKYVGPKTVTFSIEIGKNPNNHYGVYFRRLHGGVWNYKRICTKLVQMMKL